MADSADMADAIQAEMIDIAVRKARNVVLAGISGECEQCEWWMPRLVEGRCAFCRDGRPRPPGWEPPPRPDPVIFDPPTESAAMATKTIMLPAYATAAIEGVEKYAKDNETTIGAAAAALIELGMLPPPTPLHLEPALDRGLSTFGTEELLGELGRRMADSAELVFEKGRADAAEALAASLRETLEETTTRANTAIGKLASMRAALDA